MNNPNPFVPKGSLLEQQSVRRSRLKIVVGCVLGLSVCALVAMLIEGCKREAPDQGSTPPPPPDLTTSSAAMDTNLPPQIPTNLTPMMAAAPSNSTQQLPPIPMPPQPQQQMQPVPDQTGGAASTYEVVSGDTLGKIAKAHGVSLKALEAANPGVDPKKLKIKQKLNIPAPTATATAETSTSGNAGGVSSSGGTVYVVKSGDTISKIAKQNGVSRKALRAANPSIASTDHIKVGDKLTIPAKTETAAPTTTDTSAPPMVPTAPPSTPVPGTSAPSTPAPGH